MVRTIKVLKDFGERGVPAYKIMMDYKDEATYDLPEYLNKGLTRAWADSQENNTRLSNNQLMNLKKISDTEDITVLSLGPSQFRDYYEMKQFSDGKDDYSIYGLSNKDIEYVEKEVQVLSSFPSLIVEDHILMGKKGKQTLNAGAGKISFPGAGYLDKNKDTFILDGLRYTKQPQHIIERELREEVGTQSDDLYGINVLAIAEDTYNGSHKNPGIMSVVNSKISIDEIKKNKAITEDSWEHEGPYIFVPVNEETIYSLIESDTSLGNIPIPKEYAREIDGLGNIETLETTGKSGFMLPLLGRYFFGDKFYEEILEKYQDKLIIK